MAKETVPRIGLIIEPLPDPIPWPVRVRRGLKALLRSYGLRCKLFVDPDKLEAETRNPKGADDAVQ